jgi:predicted DNA binding CopG/RHH family protein
MGDEAVAVMRKQIPELRSDVAAEHFVETADLAEHDLSGFKPACFEYAKHAARVSEGDPGPRLDGVRT